MNYMKKQQAGFVLVGFTFFSLLFTHHQASKASSSRVPQLKAAIVDHLSISFPNKAFVNDCTSLIEAAGYEVDYYDGKQVTVDFYRELPAHDYNLIILRAHSAYIREYLSLAFFTSEPYRKNKYVYEQLRNRVASGHTPYSKRPTRYFVITDKFVRYSMQGKFKDAAIVMMGCSGIKQCAANAFVQKGAKAYIGWQGSVSSQHTDKATLCLLESLLEKGNCIGKAVGDTMNMIGCDPKYNSTLLYWPIKAGRYTVPVRRKTSGNDHKR